jgi:hypothetical protein
MVHEWFTKYNIGSMNPKFHDSCFGFMCRAMANGRRYLDLKVLGPSPNFKNDLSFS